MRGYIREIDSLRAGAVLLVLVHHWLTGFFEAFPIGRFGVRLFFVLSGFLITSILLESRTRIAAGASTVGGELKTFYARRTLRIFPVYYALLVVTAAAGMSVVVDTLPWHMLYASNVYFALRGEWNEYVTHLWSLSVEEQFYAVWPLTILFLPRRWMLAGLIGLVVAAPLFRLALALADVNPIAVRILTPSCFDTLGMGALLAFARFNDWGTERWTARCFVLGAPLLVATLIVGLRAPDAVFVLVFQDFAVGLLSVAVLNLVILNAGAAWLAPLRLKPILYVGQISYGIYLYHLFVTHAVASALPTAGSASKIPLYLIGTLLVAALSWELFEKPINGLKRHFPYAPATRFSNEAPSAVL